MKLLTMLYLTMILLMYPFWNIILILSFVDYGVGISSLIFNIKLYVPLFIFILMLVFFYIKSVSFNISTIALTIVVIYLLILNILNYTIGSIYSLKDSIINFLTIFMLITIFLIPTFNIKPYIRIEKINFFLKAFLFISLIIVLLGFMEKLFISNELLEISHYYSLLGSAKGMDFRTYIHPVPDNLYSGFLGTRIRRMISIVGEPLYLSYYLLIPFIFSFMIYLKKKNTISFFLLILFFLGIILPLSRNVILAAIFSVFLIMILHTKYKSYILLASIIISPFIIFSIILATNYLLQNDSSFIGHIFSFTYFLNYIGIQGILFPNEDTILNNFLLLKNGGLYTVESAFIILLSNTGLILFIITVYYFFYILKKQINVGKLIDKVYYTKKSFYAYIFYLIFPFIMISYLITALLAPHIVTFQMLFLINGLSILYLMIKTNFNKQKGYSQ